MQRRMTGGGLNKMTRPVVPMFNSRSASGWVESSPQEAGHHPSVGVNDVTILMMTTQDCELQRPFFNGLSAASRYARFMGPMAEISTRLLRVLSDIHPLRHVVYVAVVTIDAKETMVGEVRYVVDPPDNQTAEFAVSIADEWQGMGLATQLLRVIETVAANDGIMRLFGITLNDNVAMKKLGQSAGYRLSADPCEARAVRIVKSIVRPDTLH